jgi:hypothetical protein
MIFEKLYAFEVSKMPPPFAKLYDFELETTDESFTARWTLTVVIPGGRLP